MVRSTGRALLDLAADERDRMPAPVVVAITGSNGQDLTKDLHRRRAGARGLRTHASPASFNNEVGLPADAARAPPDDGGRSCARWARAGVGDVRLLCEVARPDVGGRDERRASRTWRSSARWEAIVERRPSRSSALGPDGVGRPERRRPGGAPATRAHARGGSCTFGLAAGADVRAEDVELGPDGARVVHAQLAGERRPA